MFTKEKKIQGSQWLQLSRKVVVRNNTPHKKGKSKEKTLIREK